MGRGLAVFIKEATKMPDIGCSCPATGFDFHRHNLPGSLDHKVHFCS